MADLLVTLHSQQALDERGRFQSHQWAEIPDDLSVLYMTGGLKRVRRMVESHSRFADYAPDTARWVRASWHRGQAEMRLRRLGIPLLHLDRLRQSGTVDAYRGHLDILGGAILAREALASPMPWPDDLPWAAPSAGEFDIQAEQQRPPYLGVVEFRVYRRPGGCSAHLFVRDLPPTRRGLLAWVWSRPWMPFTAAPNLAFLRADVQAAAQESGHRVQFDSREHDGAPAPLPPIRALTDTFSTLVQGKGESDGVAGAAATRHPAPGHGPGGH